jgi:hypothetical protein
VIPTPIELMEIAETCHVLAVEYGVQLRVNVSALMRCPAFERLTDQLNDLSEIHRPANRASEAEARMRNTWPEFADRVIGATLAIRSYDYWLTEDRKALDIPDEDVLLAQVLLGHTIAAEMILAAENRKMREAFGI